MITQYPSYITQFAAKSAALKGTDIRITLNNKFSPKLLFGCLQ